jgi:hypothetical protein
LGRLLSERPGRADSGASGEEGVDEAKKVGRFRRAVPAFTLFELVIGRWWHLQLMVYAYVYGSVRE